MLSRTNRASRLAWTVAYLFLTLAGIVACFSPAQVITNALVEVLVYVWAAFLIVGGGMSLGGKLFGNWSGEIIGLPLVSASCEVLGILLLIRGTSSAAIAIGGMFCGFGTAMIGRWIELRKLAKANQGVNSGI